MLKKNFEIFLNIALVIIITLLWLSQVSLRNEFDKLVAQKETPIPSISKSTSKNKTVSPHTQLIEKIQAENGISLSRIANLIIRDENIKNTPYTDNAGIVTIGAGRSLQTNGISITELHAIVATPAYKKILLHTNVKNGRIYIDSLKLANEILQNPLTEHDIALLLTDDLKNTTTEAKTVFPNWNTLSEPRQEAIVDILYNTGLPHFKSFTNFIKNIKSEDWEAAANDLLLSKAARTHIIRYHRNASVIRTNDAQFFELQ